MKDPTDGHVVHDDRPHSDQNVIRFHNHEEYNCGQLSLERQRLCSEAARHMNCRTVLYIRAVADSYMTFMHES